MVIFVIGFFFFWNVVLVGKLDLKMCCTFGKYGKGFFIFGQFKYERGFPWSAAVLPLPGKKGLSIIVVQSGGCCG